MLDDPPIGKCNRCQRMAWESRLIGTEDRMLQPDGNPCGGRFIPIEQSRCDPLGAGDPDMEAR